MNHHSPKSAFTLVELAIVIVIIGLLTAGVVGAQSLIESGNRIAIIKEFENIDKAYMAFRLEYDAIPGDMRDASSYWGGKSYCNTSAATYWYCDGDGDGNIEPANNPAGGYSYESLKAWIHLYHSELLQKNINLGFSIWCQSNGACPQKSEIIKDAYYNLEYLNGVNSIGLKAGTIYNSGSVSWGLNPAAAISPTRAFWIDKKLDDGNPSSGKFTGYNGNVAGQTCIDSIDSNKYYIANPNVGCRLLKKLN